MIPFLVYTIKIGKDNARNLIFYTRSLTKKSVSNLVQNKNEESFMKNFCLIFIIVSLLFACSSIQKIQKPEDLVQPKEVIVQYITLEGEISEPKAEISGLAWYGDYLILLPQYPHFFPSEYDGSIFCNSQIKDCRES